METQLSAANARGKHSNVNEQCPILSTELREEEDELGKIVIQYKVQF